MTARLSLAPLLLRSNYNMAEQCFHSNYVTVHNYYSSVISRICTPLRLHLFALNACKHVCYGQLSMCGHTVLSSWLWVGCHCMHVDLLWHMLIYTSVLTILARDGACAAAYDMLSVILASFFSCSHGSFKNVTSSTKKTCWSVLQWMAIKLYYYTFKHIILYMCIIIPFCTCTIMHVYILWWDGSANLLF